MRHNSVQPYQRVSRRQNLPPTLDDAYRLKNKYEEPTQCPDCHAVYHKGRWQWLATPADAASKRCPACQRIHDAYPAGCVEFSGPFFDTHRMEIEQLISNVADHAKQEHPLKRIMRPAEVPVDGSLVLNTTEVHLARELGEAVHHAFQGELDYQYSSAENMMRVVWRR